MANVTDLSPGDRIEILYRSASGNSEHGTELRDRWIAAEIKSMDNGAWPLARLADGQLTEVRRFMEWRYASGLFRRPHPHPRSA